MLAIINRLFRPQWNLFGARIGWGAVVSSVVFGLLRGLWFDDRLTIHMNAIAIRNAALSGFVFAWLRERTGSLLMPIVAHGAEDVLMFLPRML